MAEDPAVDSEDNPEGGRRVINLDDLEPASTGVPLIDRGMQLSMDEFELAVDDPDHPDHEAATAAHSHISQKMRKTLDTTFGEPFRRIGENLSAALRPDLERLFTTPTVDIPRLANGARLPASPSSSLHDSTDWELDDTPQRTLESLVEVSERMSELVRVSAEHREVALRQMEHFQAEAEASRRSERRMLWLTLLAVIGSYVAIAVAIFTR